MCSAKQDFTTVVLAGEEPRAAGTQRCLAFGEGIAELRVELCCAHGVIIVRWIVNILDVARVPRKQARKGFLRRRIAYMLERLLHPLPMLKGQAQFAPDAVAVRDQIDSERGA